MLRILLLACLAFAPSAFASGGGAVGHNLLWLAIILVAARVFSPLAARLGFPAVLGELLLGVALGNLGLLGIDYFDQVRSDTIVAFLSELGVIVLLLQIGLETRLGDLVRVGGRALSVATVGVLLPFALGTLLVGPLLLPGQTGNTYLFLGATLAATSVGITGRVFRDLACLASRDARIVLGAAVIDDVLGLVVLAVVTGLVQSGSISLMQVLRIIVEAIAFLALSIVFGRILAARLGEWLAKLDAGPSMLFALVLGTGLLLAWLAHMVGLAPIIGAFAAGLLFEPIYLQHFEKPRVVQEAAPLLEELGPDVRERMQTILQRHVSHQHEHLLEPVAYFFVPVFFVLTGMQVDLRSMADPQILIVALGITLAAIVGKLGAGFAGGPGVRHWVIGWGMVPRGEVGLIFAMAGRQLGVVSDTVFSIIVVMVILTTLVTPPVLTWLLRRPVG